MSKPWFNKLFGFGRKRIPQQIKEIKTVQKIPEKIENNTKTVATQAIRNDSPSLGSQLSYGKWYYGVDTSVPPTVKRYAGGIEKRYPCKDGGEVVLNYVSRADNSSRLSITKTGNPNDSHKGDWYKHFYSEICVKSFKDRLGSLGTKIIKKKGANKQVISTQNGRPTEEVHVPLKRWSRIINSFGFGSKKINNINPHNSRDFDRFCD